MAPKIGNYPKPRHKILPPPALSDKELKRISRDQIMKRLGALASELVEVAADVATLADLSEETISENHDGGEWDG